MQEVGNVEAIVKAIDDNDDSFFFVPWIGKEYMTGLLSKKVLIVDADFVRIFGKTLLWR